MVLTPVIKYRGTRFHQSHIDSHVQWARASLLEAPPLSLLSLPALVTEDSLYRKPWLFVSGDKLYPARSELRRLLSQLNQHQQQQHADDYLAHNDSALTSADHIEMVASSQTSSFFPSPSHNALASTSKCLPGDEMLVYASSVHDKTALINGSCHFLDEPLVPMGVLTHIATTTDATNDATNDAAARLWPPALPKSDMRPLTDPLIDDGGRFMCGEEYQRLELVDVSTSNHLSNCRLPIDCDMVLDHHTEIDNILPTPEQLTYPRQLAIQQLVCMSVLPAPLASVHATVSDGGDRSVMSQSSRTAPYAQSDNILGTGQRRRSVHGGSQPILCVAPLRVEDGGSHRSSGEHSNNTTPGHNTTNIARQPSVRSSGIYMSSSEAQGCRDEFSPARHSLDGRVKHSDHVISTAASVRSVSLELSPSLMTFGQPARKAACEMSESQSQPSEQSMQIASNAGQFDTAKEGQQMTQHQNHSQPVTRLLSPLWSTDNLHVPTVTLAARLSNVAVDTHVNSKTVSEKDELVSISASSALSMAESRRQKMAYTWHRASSAPVTKCPWSGAERCSVKTDITVAQNTTSPQFKTQNGGQNAQSSHLSGIVQDNKLSSQSANDEPDATSNETIHPIVVYNIENTIHQSPEEALNSTEHKSDGYEACTNANQDSEPKHVLCVQQPYIPSFGDTIAPIECVVLENVVNPLVIDEILIMDSAKNDGNLKKANDNTTNDKETSNTASAIVCDGQAVTQQMLTKDSIVPITPSEPRDLLSAEPIDMNPENPLPTQPVEINNANQNKKTENEGTTSSGTPPLSEGTSPSEHANSPDKVDQEKADKHRVITDTQQYTYITNHSSMPHSTENEHSLERFAEVNSSIDQPAAVVSREYLDIVPYTKARGCASDAAKNIDNQSSQVDSMDQYQENASVDSIDGLVEKCVESYINIKHVQSDDMPHLDKKLPTCDNRGACNADNTTKCRNNVLGCELKECLTVSDQLQHHCGVTSEINVLNTTFKQADHTSGTDENADSCLELNSEEKAASKYHEKTSEVKAADQCFSYDGLSSCLTMVDPPECSGKNTNAAVNSIDVETSRIIPTSDHKLSYNGDPQHDVYQYEKCVNDIPRQAHVADDKLVKKVIESNKQNPNCWNNTVTSEQISEIMNEPIEGISSERTPLKLNVIPSDSNHNNQIHTNENPSRQLKGTQTQTKDTQLKGNQEKNQSPVRTTRLAITAYYEELAEQSADTISSQNTAESMNVSLRDKKQGEMIGRPTTEKHSNSSISSPAFNQDKIKNTSINNVITLQQPITGNRTISNQNIKGRLIESNHSPENSGRTQCTAGSSCSLFSPSVDINTAIMKCQLLQQDNNKTDGDINSGHNEKHHHSRSDSAQRTFEPHSTKDRRQNRYIRDERNSTDHSVSFANSNKHFMTQAISGRPKRVYEDEQHTNAKQTCFGSNPSIKCKNSSNFTSMNSANGAGANIERIHKNMANKRQYFDDGFPRENEFTQQKRNRNPSVSYQSTSHVIPEHCKYNETSDTNKRVVNKEIGSKQMFTQRVSDRLRNLIGFRFNSDGDSSRSNIAQDRTNATHNASEQLSNCEINRAGAARTISVNDQIYNPPSLDKVVLDENCKTSDVTADAYQDREKANDDDALMTRFRQKVEDGARQTLSARSCNVPTSSIARKNRLLNRNCISTSPKAKNNRNFRLTDEKVTYREYLRDRSDEQSGIPMPAIVPSTSTEVHEVMVSPADLEPFNGSLLSNDHSAARPSPVVQPRTTVYKSAHIFAHLDATLAECMSELREAAEELLIYLQMHESNSFDTTPCGQTRAWLVNMTERSSHCSSLPNNERKRLRRQYQSVLALHGLLKCRDLLVSVSVLGAASCLTTHAHSHKDLLRGCLDSIISRLNMRANQHKRQHPRLKAALHFILLQRATFGRMASDDKLLIVVQPMAACVKVAVDEIQSQLDSRLSCHSVLVTDLTAGPQLDAILQQHSVVISYSENNNDDSLAHWPLHRFSLVVDLTRTSLVPANIATTDNELNDEYSPLVRRCRRCGVALLSVSMTYPPAQLPRPQSPPQTPPQAPPQPPPMRSPKSAEFSSVGAGGKPRNSDESTRQGDGRTSISEERRVLAAYRPEGADVAPIKEVQEEQIVRPVVVAPSVSVVRQWKLDELNARGVRVLTPTSGVVLSGGSGAVTTDLLLSARCCMLLRQPSAALTPLIYSDVMSFRWQCDRCWLIVVAEGQHRQFFSSLKQYLSRLADVAGFSVRLIHVAPAALVDVLLDIVHQENQCECWASLQNWTGECSDMLRKLCVIPSMNLVAAYLVQQAYADVASLQTSSLQQLMQRLPLVPRKTLQRIVDYFNKSQEHNADAVATPAHITATPSGSRSVINDRTSPDKRCYGASTADQVLHMINARIPSSADCHDTNIDDNHADSQPMDLTPT